MPNTAKSCETKPLSARGEELDQLSRQRSLSDLESLELERELLNASGDRLPNGYYRELLRSRNKLTIVSRDDDGRYSVS